MNPHPSQSHHRRLRESLGNRSGSLGGRQQGSSTQVVGTPSDADLAELRRRQRESHLQHAKKGQENSGGHSHSENRSGSLGGRQQSSSTQVVGTPSNAHLAELQRRQRESHLQHAKRVQENSGGHSHSQGQRR